MTEMIGLKNISTHRAYGIASILCPIAALAFIALEAWRLEVPSAGGSGLADFGGVWILVLILWLMPISSLIGFLLGIRSFALQLRINGIGLWGIILNTALIILIALIWGRFWGLTR